MVISNFAAAGRRDLRIVGSGTLGVLVRAVKRGILSAEEGNQLLGEMIGRGYRSPYSRLESLLEEV